METKNNLAVVAARLRFPDMYKVQTHNEVAREARQQLDFSICMGNGLMVTYWETILEEIDKKAVARARKF